jgi:hypothetical protein
MRNTAEERPEAVRFGFALGVLAALPALIYLRGFTVDDALIPARYAAHIAAGLGYRFNAEGPSTDGVTPLGFPYLLAPFAAGGPLAALSAARNLGAVAWLAAAGALGAAIASLAGSPARYAALLLVVVSAPLGAWASAGLETGITVALVTFAAVLPVRPSWSAAAGGLLGAAAWLRPEMIAYSSLLAVPRFRIATTRSAKRLTAMLAAGPWLFTAILRWALWGRPAPLAVFAKPSDLAHGAIYVLPALLFTGAPLAALGPIAWARLPEWPRTLIAGAFVHLGVVVLAGGDWMPLARLICPVLPPLAFAVAHLLSSPKALLMTSLRLLIGCGGEVIVLVMRGPAAAHVLSDRLALIEAARPALAGASAVATLDVGWVGAATSATIVDLAGATDPAIAVLPGGHTSKAVSGMLLAARKTDRLVFELDERTPQSLAFTRATEARLFVDPFVTRDFRPLWRSPEALPIHYVILSRVQRDPSDGP